METDAVAFCSIAAIQAVIMLYACWALLAFGRITLPSVFEPIAIMAVTQCLRIGVSVPVWFEYGWKPDIHDWSLLLYDILLPVVLIRVIFDRLGKKMPWALASSSPSRR
jgi:hypothetical protein